MSLAQSLLAAVRQHQSLGQQILEIVEQESQTLAAGHSALPGPLAERKRALLPLIDQSLRQLRLHREAWVRLTPEDRGREPQVSAALRATQDLLMKVIVRDRENEQHLLRAGNVPPQHLAKVQAVARPHYVADLYRRNVAAPAQP
ncbi:MAG TPA: hypothetical protein DCM86_10105 [Verrucomicrobiales bacterium]|nr:hypothetical protein [Verrucomicrobiales bacterium]